MCASAADNSESILCSTVLQRLSAQEQALLLDILLSRNRRPGVHHQPIVHRLFFPVDVMDDSFAPALTRGPLSCIQRKCSGNFGSSPAHSIVVATQPSIYGHSSPRWLSDKENHTQEAFHPRSVLRGKEVLSKKLYPPMFNLRPW